MLEAKLFLGNVYGNRQDLPNMERHYRVGQRLAEDLQDESALRAIGYNTASVWIETGRYEEAYAWFSGQEQPTLMALHKLAICCEKDRAARGSAARIDAGGSHGHRRDRPRACPAAAQLVRYRLEHPDYLTHDDYGTLLLDSFDRLKRNCRLAMRSFICLGCWNGTRQPGSIKGLRAAGSIFSRKKRRKAHFSPYIGRDFPKYTGCFFLHRSATLFAEVMNMKTAKLWTRNFRLVILASAMGTIGAIAGSFALAFLVFDETGSTLASALIVAIQLLPYLLLPVLIAPLMDRLPRKAFGRGRSRKRRTAGGMGLWLLALIFPMSAIWRCPCCWPALARWMNSRSPASTRS